MKRYFLVRHGETDLNALGVFYGNTDCPLNEKGKTQSKFVGEYLSKIVFDKVYTSPFIRAVDSKNIILAENENKESYEEIYDDRLKEINFGIWENKYVEEIEKMDPEYWKLYFKGWPDVPAPEGENFAAFFLRVKSFFSEVMNAADQSEVTNTNQSEVIETGQNKNDENILIVAHKGSIGLMPVFAMNLGIRDYWKFSIEQGYYSVITEDKGKFYIEKLNTKAILT